nr:hypothetical protein [uncultured bacterium]
MKFLTLILALCLGQILTTVSLCAAAGPDVSASTLELAPPDEAVVLKKHGAKVKFRNIWVVEKPSQDPPSS